MPISYGDTKVPDVSDKAALSGLTCDRCLGLGKAMNHGLCERPWGEPDGCPCPCNRKRLSSRKTGLKKPSRKKIEKEPRNTDDIPAEVRVRNGRYMTPEQVEWASTLRKRGWGLKEIGITLGGFSHASVFRNIALFEKASG